LKLDFPVFDDWCKSVKVTRIATVARKKEAVKEIYKSRSFNFRRKPHGYDGQLRKKQ